MPADYNQVTVSIGRLRVPGPMGRRERDALGADIASQLARLLAADRRQGLPAHPFAGPIAAAIHQAMHAQEEPR